MKFVMMAAAALLAACSASDGATARAQVPDTASAATPARHPVSGLAVIDLAVETSAGRVPLRVEVAASPQAQARGLMFRTELGDREGMIFPSAVPEVRSFWMKNTPLSLDIIFIGPDRRITNIAANTVPYSLDPVPSSGVAAAVLELRAGQAGALGIAPGDKVEYQIPATQGS